MPELPALQKTSATEIYERGLDELLSSDNPSAYYAVDETGHRLRLPLDRWISTAPAEEELLLDRAAGPVLDIGCGAGRHLAALKRRGVESSGVEVSRRAVEIARAQGVEVIHGSVFDLDAASAWNSALLLDGNIGIGAEPSRLLNRVGELLHPGGAALVEVEPPGAESRVLMLHLQGPDRVSDWFPWARVGADGIAAIAAEAGFRQVELFSIGGRWFSELTQAKAG